jgi:hypothetical protein
MQFNKVWLNQTTLALTKFIDNIIENYNSK